MKNWQGFLIRIPFLWVEGMALFPFVLFRTGSPTERLRNHEAIHLRQQLELGIVLFYVWYILEYLYRRIQYPNHYAAYRAISFEQEAFLHEADVDYLNHRKFWAFRLYV